MGILIIPLLSLLMPVSCQSFSNLTLDPFHPTRVSSNPRLIPTESSRSIGFSNLTLDSLDPTLVSSNLRLLPTDPSLRELPTHPSLRELPTDPSLAHRSSGCPSGTFACHYDSTRCILQSWVCNGLGGGCADFSNMLVSACNDCAADHLFKCQYFGKSLCLNKQQYMCDGKSLHCEDFADELASLCEDCAADHLFKCENSGKSFCLDKKKYMCDRSLGALRAPTSSWWHFGPA